MNEIAVELVTRIKNVHSIQDKNGHKWSRQAPSRRGRPTRDNIFLPLPGPKGEAHSVKSPEEAWNLLLNDQIIDIMVHTNECIHMSNE